MPGKRDNLDADNRGCIASSHRPRLRSNKVASGIKSRSSMAWRRTREGRPRCSDTERPQMRDSIVRADCIASSEALPGARLNSQTRGIFISRAKPNDARDSVSMTDVMTPGRRIAIFAIDTYFNDVLEPPTSDRFLPASMNFKIANTRAARNASQAISFYDNVQDCSCARNCNFCALDRFSKLIPARQIDVSEIDFHSNFAD